MWPTCQLLLNCMLCFTDVQPQQDVEMTQQVQLWVPCMSKDHRAMCRLSWQAQGLYGRIMFCVDTINMFCTLQPAKQAYILQGQAGSICAYL